MSADDHRLGAAMSRLTGCASPVPGERLILNGSDRRRRAHTIRSIPEPYSNCRQEETAWHTKKLASFRLRDMPFGLTITGRRCYPSRLPAPCSKVYTAEGMMASSHCHHS